MPSPLRYRRGSWIGTLFLEPTKTMHRMQCTAWIGECSILKTLSQSMTQDGKLYCNPKDKLPSCVNCELAGKRPSQTFVLELHTWYVRSKSKVEASQECTPLLCAHSKEYYCMPLCIASIEHAASQHTMDIHICTSVFFN